MDVFWRMFALLCGREENVKVIFDVFLANIFVPAMRAEGLVKKTNILIFRRGVLRGY
jgi:hypothetical protein